MSVLNTILGFLRPISIILGAGIGQLTLSLADGTLAFPATWKGLIPTLTSVLLTTYVVLAVWLATHNCERACRERDRLKDEHFEELLQIAREGTARMEAFSRNIPLRVRGRVVDEMDDLGIH